MPANAVTLTRVNVGNIEATASQKYDSIDPVSNAPASVPLVFALGETITEVYNAEFTDDGDAADEGITYRLENTITDVADPELKDDASLFDIVAASGVVTFRNSPTEGTYDIVIVGEDKAGHRATTTLNIRVVPAPTITSVAAPNGFYKVGDSVPVTVTFSKAVTVDTTGGTPQLALSTGNSGGTGTADYTSGTGTVDLTFTYTVRAGDNINDLAYTGTTALELNSGTIQSVVDDIPATLTLPMVGIANSLSGSSAVVLDTTAPVFTSGAIGAVAVGAAIARVAYDATATDNDGDADDGIIYTLSGTHFDLFTIVPESGMVTYKDIRSVAVAADHSIIITATDTAGNPATQTVTISVLGAPAVIITSSTPIGEYANAAVTFTFTFSEGIEASKLDGFTTEDITVTGGSKSMFATIFADERYTVVATPTASTNDGVLTVTVRVDAVMGTTTGTNNRVATATQNYDTVRTGVLQHDGTDMAMFVINDPSTEIYNANATDGGGTVDDRITYRFGGGANAGLFNINPDTGSVTYITSPIEAAEHTIVITATDKGGNTDTITVTVMAVFSSDSGLSALTIVTSGGAAVPLTPVFATAATAYTANVIQKVTSVTITLPTAHAGATAVITGTAADGTALTVTDSTATGSTATSAIVSGLTEGISPNNTIIVTVTAADGSTTVYTITLIRAPLLTFGTTADGITAITIVDKTYNIDKTIPALTLPIATGGIGTLSYTLTPAADIPEGLTFTSATSSILSGTPTALVTRTLTYRVTDSAVLPVSTPLTFEVKIQRVRVVTSDETEIPLNLDGDGRRHHRRPQKRNPDPAHEPPGHTW